MCGKHKPRARTLGDATAKPVGPHEYRSEVLQVRQLFAENSTHPGLTATLRALEDWMQQARSGEGLSVKEQPYPSAPEVARLVRHGVQAVDILVTVCGHLQWQRSNPHRLPSDAARDFALSRAVMKLAPRPLKQSPHQRSKGYRTIPKFAALQHLGMFLRQWLSDFLAVVQLALEQRAAQKVKLKQDLRTPFGAPVVAFMDESKPPAQRR